MHAKAFTGVSLVAAVTLRLKEPDSLRSRACPFIGGGLLLYPGLVNLWMQGVRFSAVFLC